MEDAPGERHLNIHFTPEIMAGVYANFANVSHSPYEFTITFARVDHEVEEEEVPGVVVSRVNLSPRFMQELIEAMEDNYSKWKTREGIKNLPEFDGESDDDYGAEEEDGEEERGATAIRSITGGWSNSAHTIDRGGAGLERLVMASRRCSASIPAGSCVARRPAQSASASIRREIRFSTGSSTIAAVRAQAKITGTEEASSKRPRQSREAAASTSRIAGTPITPNQSTPLSVCKRCTWPSSCASSARSCAGGACSAVSSTTTRTVGPSPSTSAFSPVVRDDASATRIEAGCAPIVCSSAAACAAAAAGGGVVDMNSGSISTGCTTVKTATAIQAATATPAGPNRRYAIRPSPYTAATATAWTAQASSASRAQAAVLCRSRPTSTARRCDQKSNGSAAAEIANAPAAAATTAGMRAASGRAHSTSSQAASSCAASAASVIA